MNALPSSAQGELRVFVFKGLPAYSHQEAVLTTWLARAFPSQPDWGGWIREAWADFLERPAGLEVRLTQRHSVDPAQPEIQHAFEKNEIVIGRDPQADVCLPVRSIGSRHACLSITNGACALEDLGTSLGTYVNKVRLAPKIPRALASGDRFDIFPYSFEVELRQLWVRDADVQVEAGSGIPMTWPAFAESAPRGRTSFPIDFSPGGRVCLEAGEFFLEEFLHRLLLPLGIAPERLGLTETDSGFIELLVTALLARMNRDLRFPFHAQPGPLGSRVEYPKHFRGLMLPLTVRVAGLTGAFRLFLPFAVLAAAAPCRPDARRSLPEDLVSWAFPVSAGYVDLSAEELATLEPGDVVLYNADAQLLAPGFPDRGWKVAFTGGNLREARVDNSFERPPLTYDPSQTPDGAAGAARPDFHQLPVRLHVILGEKELTLAEASALVSGSILELGLEKTDSVRLALNGKIVGEGKLVEVEGRLGVRVGSWRTAG